MKSINTGPCWATSRIYLIKSSIKYKIAFTIFNVLFIILLLDTATVFGVRRQRNLSCKYIVGHVLLIGLRRKVQPSLNTFRYVSIFHVYIIKP